MERADVDKPKWLTTIQSIDKLDKKSREEVELELAEKGLSTVSIKAIFDSLEKAKPDDFLEKVMDSSEKLGATSLKFDPTLSRGLDYYTGPIFETVVEAPKIGSLTGGGRYDKLLSIIGGVDLPATGSTIGLERIIDVINELGLFKDITLSVVKALITVYSPELADYALEVTSKLRTEGINSELYVDLGAPFNKQLKYADKKLIPNVILLGPVEKEKNTVTIKNLSDGSQKSLSLDEAIALLKT
jgi:histidyl-tRNA synthetase